MEKVDFQNSIAELKDNFGFNTRSFPAFSFGTPEECREILKTAIQNVDKTIVNLKWLPEYDEIADYLNDTKGKGLFLAGDVGRGKTTIIHHAIPLLFYHYQRKVVKCTHANELKHHLQEYKNKLFIAIDEVGTEAVVNDYGSKYEPVNNLFDMAESQGKIIFISTNLNSTAIRERYGVRTLDRITRLCRIVKFKGESLRK